MRLAKSLAEAHKKWLGIINTFIHIHSSTQNSYLLPIQHLNVLFFFYSIHVHIMIFERRHAKVWVDRLWWLCCVSIAIDDENHGEKWLPSPFAPSTVPRDSKPKQFSYCCVWFQCFTQFFFSSFSDFVDCWFVRMEKSGLFMDVICVLFLCFYNSDWVLWVLCLISMHHLVMLLLCCQYCSLWFDDNRRVDCLWMSFVCFFSCVYHPDWVQWVLCLISINHSVMLLLFLQLSCLFD